MNKIIITSLFVFSLAHGVVLPQSNSVGGSVVPADKTYYKHTQNNIEIIHTKDNLEFAKHTAEIEPSLHKDYEEFYQWKLDEKLSVGLISDNNQIANGFSTQLPNNRQINYIGGTAFIDYFTTTSWLDTLLYHETAHNYQVNVKASGVSQSLHSVFGNGFFFIPLFTVPNYAENSFMLEGNAVLNESWHGNGGRLYSGRFKAQTILQAKAGKIKAGEVYNKKIEFPYGNIVYIQGGFYNYYMAQKYSLKSINSYFKYHSQAWYWPFLTNESMFESVGLDFERSLSEFASEYASKNLVLAKGELIASSQFFYQLNSDKKEIYFLTNETAKRAPELIKIDKSSMDVTKKRGSWSAAKLVKADGRYYSQASSKISPTKIIQGLYDEDRFLKEGSGSKMIQGYLSDKRAIYFDVKKSYSQAQLFVGDSFYAQVNSSVYIDAKDNLYYFIQDKKTRTLYKNKIPLYSMQGYYGFVNDVDSKGAVYFIANTENGSSLFKYMDAKVTRVNDGDNVIEARLINDKEVLIAAISDKDYYYVKTTLQDIEDEPFDVKLFFEDKEYFARNRIDSSSNKNLPDLSHEYNSFTDMRYSGVDLSYGISSDGTDIWQVNLKYADPLTQNALNLFVSKDLNNVTIGGLGYNSALNRVNYGISAYGVLKNSYKDILGKKVDVREVGVIADARLPIYENGYYASDLKVSFYQDYNTLNREPLSIELSLSKTEHYLYSMFLNYLNAIDLYAASERGDRIYGTKYSFKYDLGAEFYFSLNAKYSIVEKNLSNANTQKRGVKVSAYGNTKDPSVIDMRSIYGDLYLKSAGYVDVGLAKVLNFSSYWFTFPLSLQREAIYAKYKYFNLEGFSGVRVDVNEATLGFSASVVVFNNFALPIGVEYIHNNTAFLVNQESQLVFTIGSSF